MNPDTKIEKLIALLEAGKTVYISSTWRSYPLTLKTLTKFRNAGYDLFKSDGNSVMMMVGKKYLCIDGCKIQHT